MNVKEGETLISVKELEDLSLADRWMLSRLSSVCEEVNKSLDEYRFNDAASDLYQFVWEYRFNDAASDLYQFVWHELCDWYVEMIKPELYGENEKSKKAAISTLVRVYEAALRLLHPFMPFITEEIWQQLPVIKDTDSICIRSYPVAADGIQDRGAEEKMSIIHPLN
jgi:valyl-tRNA synthetase